MQQSLVCCCAGSAGQKGKKYLIYGNFYEKIVQKKDPGNRENFVLLPGSELPVISDPLASLQGAHGALRPPFPESLTRKKYRKKIPENILNITTGLSSHSQASGVQPAGSGDRWQSNGALLRQN